MKIDIWSDVVCPFCYIGKRHLEKALEQLPEIEADINWKSFELDPNAPLNSDLDIYDTLAKKYDRDRNWAKQMNQNVVEMAERVGLNYNMDQIKPTNSFNAHQLIHFAKSHNKQNEMKEALMAAYFTEGKHIGQTEVLTEIAGSVGLDKPEAAKVLSENRYSSEVVKEVEQAHSLGIQGVPFFFINEEYGLSGAQPVEVFVNTLKEINSK